VHTLLNIACCPESLSEYRDAADFEQSYRQCGCDGVEMIYAEEDKTNMLDSKSIVGLHLSFYPDWIDFWNGNKEALLKEFGTQDTYEWFYGGKDRSTLIHNFTTDLERAEALNVRYVVFHVSNVTISETYTYRMEHTNEEIIDAAADLINVILDDKKYNFDFLMENLAWPGLTMTQPAVTQRLLNKVHCPRKGIMLDIGHLMNTNIDLQSEEEACAYVNKMLDAHGELTKFIKGVHLHQSLSGSYVKQCLKNPAIPIGDYCQRMAQAYDHINKIDWHRPMTCAGTKALIERIAPKYLVYELNAKNRVEREHLLKIQTDALNAAGNTVKTYL
jgi:hypothetical protein